MNEKTCLIDTDDKECCLKFHPEKWDWKTFIWENKSFIKETIPTFFHIPFPPMIGKKIWKMDKLAREANMISSDKEEVLVLFRDSSAFKSEIYLSVIWLVSNANNVTISWNFIAKVYDWWYNSVPKFIKQLDEYLLSIDKKAKDYYVHYAYCPKCSVKY